MQRESFLKKNGIYLFDLNDLSFESEEEYFKNVSVKKGFLYNLLRINFGFNDYAGIEKMSRHLICRPLVIVTFNPNYVPAASDLSFIMNKIPAKELFKYFRMLVPECIKLWIIISRILIWEGQFFRTNCKNNKDKEKNSYNDPDAGYCRHNGKKGAGYDPGILYSYCRDRGFQSISRCFPEIEVIIKHSRKRFVRS